MAVDDQKKAQPYHQNGEREKSEEDVISRQVGNILLTFTFTSNFEEIVLNIVGEPFRKLKEETSSEFHKHFSTFSS